MIYATIEIRRDDGTLIYQACSNVTDHNLNWFMPGAAPLIDHDDHAVVHGFNFKWDWRPMTMAEIKFWDGQKDAPVGDEGAE